MLAPADLPEGIGSWHVICLPCYRMTQMRDPFDGTSSAAVKTGQVYRPGVQCRTPSCLDRGSRNDRETVWRRIADLLRTTNRSRLLACIAVVAFPPNLGCDNCDGHDADEYWCDHDRILVCRWESSGNQPDTLAQCVPGGCYIGPQKGGTCILPDTPCPTANLGYQCMGEYRIRCLPDGRVEDIGACPVPVTAGSPITGTCATDVDETRQECRPYKAPYCVENPGGEALACGWRKERCDVEGEVRCFEDGSAICSGHVYTGFVANTVTGQAVCDVTKVPNCWNGKTWCEGDVLKRCDQCLGQSRCLKVSTQAVCDPGACTKYEYSWWLADLHRSVPQDAMGCGVEAPECDGTRDTVCVGDKPAACTEPGKAVIALACGDFQTFFGSDEKRVGVTYLGPLCVNSSAVENAVCALDTTPCLSGHLRCDPSDPATIALQTCRDGVWFESQSCDRARPATTRCQTSATTSSCE
jgi:hypothetical protein